MCHGQLYQQRMKKAFDKKVKPRMFREGGALMLTTMDGEDFTRPVNSDAIFVGVVPQVKLLVGLFPSMITSRVLLKTQFSPAAVSLQHGCYFWKIQSVGCYPRTLSIPSAQSRVERVLISPSWSLAAKLTHQYNTHANQSRIMEHLEKENRDLKDEIACLTAMMESVLAAQSQSSPTAATPPP
ncbi:hypothetical protein KIW84_010580 [Lathyrus oleraceus]|uniref:Uncharacterized protein n=1 Tax=Pisum sativum TaxID=3888 RepID=A0A9D4YMG9_PEA|nr:hypothetical protein KIW84_010580 [Pisum sativum]